MQKIHSRLAPVASRLQISLPDFVGISETGRSISRLAGFGLMRNDALPTTAEESSGNLDQRSVQKEGKKAEAWIAGCAELDEYDRKRDQV